MKCKVQRNNQREMNEIKKKFFSSLISLNPNVTFDNPGGSIIHANLEPGEVMTIVLPDSCVPIDEASDGVQHVQIKNIILAIHAYR